MEFENLPFTERPDLTPFLIHLTKRSEKGSTAFQNLVNILKTGHLKASGASGFIKGPNPAVCFMDIPFVSLKYVLNKENTNPNAPKYEPYGIVITKKTGYNKGLRPVLYLSNEELERLKIDKDEWWRIVRFEVNDKDWVSWLHEREWRTKGDLQLPSEPVSVLVKGLDDVKNLQELIQAAPDQFKVKPKSILPLAIVCQGLIHMD